MRLYPSVPYLFNPINPTQLQTPFLSCDGQLHQDADDFKPNSKIKEDAIFYGQYDGDVGSSLYKRDLNHIDIKFVDLVIVLSFLGNSFSCLCEWLSIIVLNASLAS